jgi:hypothetical protein
MEDGWALWRTTWLIAWLFWWPFVASLAWVLQSLVHFGVKSYVHMQHFVRRSTTNVPFLRFWGDVRREFMQRLSAALHGILGSYLRDALQEGSVDVVACLSVPRALVLWGAYFLLAPFCLVAFTAFSCKNIRISSVVMRHSFCYG